MSRTTEFVLRHKRVVVLVWLVLFAVGGALTEHTIKRLTANFSLPGQSGYITEKQIQAAYGNGDQQEPLVVTFAGTSYPRAVVSYRRLQADMPTVRVVWSPKWVAKGGHTVYALVFVPPPTAAQGFGDPFETRAQSLLSSVAPAGSTAGITSYDALSSGADTKGPGVFVETIIGGIGALAVLAFVFASFLALLPLFIAAVTILSSYLALLGLTYVTNISYIVEYLVALVGLGVAIDYSLLIVTRWREERARGLDNESAVVAAMGAAGKAVVFSGVTVAIGLVSLVVLPVPFLRSMGYGGALIPLVSVLAATTLLPALLGSIGPRADWPRIRHEGTVSRFWSRWARWVVRRRYLAACIALAILGLLIVPFFRIDIGLTSTNALAKSGEAYETYHTLVGDGVPAGVLTPMEVLVRGDGSPSVAASLTSARGVASAVAQPAVENRRGTSIAVVVPQQETVNSSSLVAVRAVKSAVHDDALVIGVAGTGPTQIDFINGVYKHLPQVIVLIVVLSFFLLARAFRSLVLPLKAVVLNLVSLAATFGAMTAFWQWGWGSKAIFSIARTGAITFWIPVLAFAFLYGLSMDYEVFILSRVREEYDALGSTDAAVVTGIGRTGRLVTSAALILFCAFASLSSAPITDIKVLATGLGFGILLDATVIRSLLVPALVAMFGRVNWLAPSFIKAPPRRRLHRRRKRNRTPRTMPALERPGESEEPVLVGSAAQR
jgi:putative drug exporter of the RND superfamily